jgi:predicted phage replisome organizer
LADVKWIKITTDIFDDEKILLIESLPDSYAIITVWFKLLCLAGKQNNSGVFMMGRIAYTDKMLATIFRMKETTVTMALQTFQQFGMVEIVDGVITIPNWGKHQNLDQLESKKQYMRNYMAEYREKQKALTTGKPNCKTNSKTNVSQAEEDIEEEIEKEVDKKESITCQQIVDLYHSICTSYPSVRSLSDARRKAIKARLNTYTLEDFQTVFENAEASSFLKGSNDRNWTATFDWLIKDANMAKVLEGNYADKQQRYTRRETKPNWMQPSLEMGEAELDAIKRMMGTQTVESNPAIAQEAEAMQQRMREKYGRKEA